MSECDPVDALQDKLAQYANRYPDESKVSELFSAFLSRHGRRSFDRALEEGHVTASCWLLSPDRQHILLTHHRKLDAWLQLGGHADGDTDVLRVALNEAREESGIADIAAVGDADIFDLDRHRIPPFGEDPAHDHYDFRFVLVAGSREVKVSPESHDLQWCKIGSLADYTSDQSVLRMERKWLAGS